MRRIDGATVSLLVVGSYAAAAGIPVRMGSSAQIVLLAVAGALLAAGWTLETIAARRPSTTEVSPFLTVVTAWTFVGVVIAIGAGLIKSTEHWKAGSLATLICVVGGLLVVVRFIADLRGADWNRIEKPLVTAVTASGAASPVLAVLGGYAIVRMVDAVLAARDSSHVPVAASIALIVFGGGCLLLGGAAIFARSGPAASDADPKPAVTTTPSPTTPSPTTPPSPTTAPAPVPASGQAVDPGPVDGTPQPWWVLAVLRTAVLAAAGGALVVCLAKYHDTSGGQRDLLIFGGVALLLAVLGDTFANLTFKGFGIDVSLSRSSTGGSTGQGHEAAAPPAAGGGAKGPLDTGGDDTSGDDTSGDDTSGDDTSGDDTSGEGKPALTDGVDIDLGLRRTRVLVPQPPVTHTDHVRIRASGRHSEQAADLIKAFLSAPR